MIRFLSTLLLALAGGALFSLLHIPIAWLLGPMVAVFIGVRLIRSLQPNWPTSMRNTAMILIGYSFGLSLTHETLLEMWRQLPTMLLMTVLLMLFCGLIAFVVSKLTGQPLATSLMGSIPGGLSQMIMLAEDSKDIDLTVVTFMQVSRLMLIVLCIPPLIFSPLFGGVHPADAARAVAEGATWEGLLPNALWFAPIIVAAAFLGQKIKLPTAFLLGPMIATAVVNLSGLEGPALPSTVLNAAQLMIGAYIGLLLHPEKLQHKVRTIGLALASGLILIGGTLGLSAFLTVLHPLSPATAFLSMAPGGMDQMGLIAKEIHADPGIVTCYQLFRTWFIFFAVTPLMRVLLKRMAHRGQTAEDKAL
ncbi:AbrB family transcriptional regulator [Paenibacillus sp. NPDC058071]|uniref:AbrB family transcriptional regulator n=1 Tax=Paenibacillus sp. NPDC058071 TaxID=3346326 RepID=UPI0036DECE7D